MTLTCSSDAAPPAEYTWYKESIDSPKAAGQNYTITNITSEDFGAYYCQARNELGSRNSTSLHITRKGEISSVDVPRDRNTGFNMNLHVHIPTNAEYVHVVSFAYFVSSGNQVS